MHTPCTWQVVTFGNPRASSRTSLSFQLLTRVFVPIGSRIELSLPGFTISEVSPVLFGASGGLVSARWRNATEKSPTDGLTITLKASLGLLSTLRLEIPATAGLRLPPHGVPLHLKTVTISAGVSGGINPAGNVQAVGSFGGTPTVMFDEVMGTLAVSFMPSMRIERGEWLDISAPSLAPLGATNLPLGGKNAKVFGGWATWRSPAVIRFSATEAIGPGQSVSVVVQRVRAAGGAVGDITISTEAVGGAVLPTAVESVCKATHDGYTKCCKGSATCL